MKKMYNWMLVFVLAFYCLGAQAQAPTDASIKQLLQVSNAQAMLVAGQVEANKQLEAQVQAMMPSLNAKQQEIAKKMLTELSGLLGKFLSWEKMEPLMMNTYKQLYTQEEVNALGQFYKSPVGSSIARKMPEMMALTQKLLQEQMATLMPEMNVIQQKYMQALREAE